MLISYGIFILNLFSWSKQAYVPFVYVLECGMAGKAIFSKFI